ncbi:MAG TPA: hypothetical protein VN643_18575 [Pyrinomonadaceae bacterium]|nr:hypothetical protein [Pyrinomonadaceae bacterium]
MRTTFFASALILGCIAAAAPQARKPRVSRAPISITSTVQHSKTRLVIRTRVGKRYSLLVSRDSNVSANAQPNKVKVIGVINKTAIILADVYPSIPGSLSYCGAGEESFLRVISVATKPPKETLKLKLESCRENLELDSEGVEWLPQTGTLRIHWLTGPAGNGTPEVREISLTNEGRPR